MYRWLEYGTFGKTLERSRRTFLEELAGCRSVIVFGAGDGRCFAPLLSAAPDALVTSVEVDRQLAAQARDRVRRQGLSDRIRFVDTDARRLEIESASQDAVVTQFFLDCFSAEELARLVPRLRLCLRPEGYWLNTDFDVPTQPALARWRARAWGRTLCLFFGWTANHAPGSLPPIDAILRQHGLRPRREARFSAGLVRTTLYRVSDPADALKGSSTAG